MLYTAKCFWPGVTEEELRLAAARVAATGAGRGRLPGALYLPRRRARARPLRVRLPADVKRASEQAGMPCERVIESVWFGPSSPPKEERTDTLRTSPAVAAAAAARGRCRPRHRRNRLCRPSDRLLPAAATGRRRGTRRRHGHGRCGNLRRRGHDRQEHPMKGAGAGATRVGRRPRHDDLARHGSDRLDRLHRRSDDHRRSQHVRARYRSHVRRRRVDRGLAARPSAVQRHRRDRLDLEQRHHGQHGASSDTIPPGFCGPRACAFNSGGGIDNGGVLTLTNTRVTNNTAGSTSAASSAASDRLPAGSTTTSRARSSCATASSAATTSSSTARSRITRVRRRYRQRRRHW